MNTGYGKEIPPVIEHIKIWFLQKGSSVDTALSFFKFYENKGWLNSRGKQICNWKTSAWEWLWM